MADLTPTEAMASAARRGLRLHEDGKSGDGLKPETVRRANIIAERQELTEDHVREMSAWFARHAADRRPGWDDPGEETPGFVAWLLWGGDPARDWSERKVAELDREQDRSTVMDGMIERRDVEFEAEDEIVVETRADGRPVIRGYAVVYGRLSVDLGGGLRERIMPGAFDETLNRQRGRTDLVSYFNHDANIMLGRESSGTLKVWSDEKGVGFEVIPPTTRADILELVQRRDVKGASFTFSLRKGGEGFVTDENGRAIREVRAANLYELGPVVQPAYPSTTAQVAMRSYEAWLASQVSLPETTPHAVGPDIVAASTRLKAARLRSFLRGQRR